jgi:hypothetical protein
VFAILFGIFPYRIPFLGVPSVLEYQQATIHQQVTDLEVWTRENHPPQAPAKAAATAAAAVNAAPAAADPIALNSPE